MKVDGKDYCDISKLSIRLVSKDVAKDIIVNNHYSGIWTKVSYAIGLFHISNDEHKFFGGVNEKLIGVACYGDPVGRHSGASISELLDRTEVLELTRLFVFDGYGSNIESWFVGKTFEWLRENAPHIKALVSYSDPKVGHLGTIYQATNWIYEGYFGGESSVIVNGKLMHRRQAYSLFGTTRPQGSINVPASGKHKYLMPLDDEMRAKIAPLAKPYPKSTRVKKQDAGHPPVLDGATPIRALQNNEAA